MMGSMRIRLTEVPRGLLECVIETDQIVVIFDDLAFLERFAAL